MDWATILAILNASIAGATVIMQIALIRRHKPALFVRGLYVIIGLYWCGLYTFVALVEPGSYNPVLFGQIFVRPAFTVTLVTMMASALYRLRSP